MNPIEERNRAWIEDLAADCAVVELNIARPPDEIDRELNILAEDLRRARRLRGERLQPSNWPVIVSLSGIEPVPDDQRRIVHDRLAGVAADTSAGPAFGDIELIVVPRCEVESAAAGAAVAYRRRRATMARRLRSVFSGVATAVSALVVFGIALVVTRGSWFLSPLAARVEEYREREGVTAAARLQEPLQRRIDTLAEILADPEFSNLSERRQRFVRDRLTELSAYRDYSTRLGKAASPLEARTDQELGDIERLLMSDLALPSDFAAAWTSTEAALRRDQALSTARQMRDHARAVVEWYRQLARQAQRLLAGPAPANAGFDWIKWSEELTQLFAESKTPPVRIDSRAQYAAVMALPSVAQARSDWDRESRRLQALGDLAQALGLAPGHPTPPLRLEDAMTVEQAAGIVARLNESYAGWRDWSPTRWPDSAAASLQPALRAFRERVLDAGRRELARRLAPAASRGTLSPAQWRAAAAELAADPALRDWRELAATSTRWLNPDAPDPIAEFADFLARDQFEVELRSVQLTLPGPLPKEPWTPAGDFVIRAQTGSAPFRSLVFRAKNGFTFTAESERTLTILPGDAIWAELPIRDLSGNAATLSWWANGVRSAAYQFDRLTRPPRMHRPEQNVEDGPLVEGATLLLVPDRGWPRLPELMPAIR